MSVGVPHASHDTEDVGIRERRVEECLAVSARDPTKLVGRDAAADEPMSDKSVVATEDDHVTRYTGKLSELDEESTSGRDGRTHALARGIDPRRPSGGPVRLEEPEARDHPWISGHRQAAAPSSRRSSAAVLARSVARKR